MRSKYGIFPFTLFAITLFLSSASYGDRKQEVTVVKVVDAETLQVLYYGKEELLRLIGVNTPEIYPNKEARREAEKTKQDVRLIIMKGKLAIKFVKSLVREKDTVLLEFDVQKRDENKKLLGYVYLDNDKMLNEEIIREGYGSPRVEKPNTKYQSNFSKAYDDARKAKRGLWNY
ncbi:MAG: thermonuclease [Planctomycetes bacterium]|nr:thermonuclease [Planctomycetota bacterium]